MLIGAFDQRVDKLTKDTFKYSEYYSFKGARLPQIAVHFLLPKPSVVMALTGNAVHGTCDDVRCNAKFVLRRRNLYQMASWDVAHVDLIQQSKDKAAD